jgi:hypothetical protein
LFLQALKTIKSDKIQLGELLGLIVNHSSLEHPELQHEFPGWKSSPGLLDRMGQTLKSIQERMRALHDFFGVAVGVQDRVAAHQHRNGFGQHSFGDIARERSNHVGEPDFGSSAYPHHVRLPPALP